MTADKTYLAVPSLTSFTIVRGKIKEGREYSNAAGQQIQRIETGGKRFDATLTTYQPVVKMINNKPVVVRFTDLGDDSFTYPGEAPSQQAEAGGAPVVTMDDLLGADVIASLRDVLVEVMTGSIPDFAEQPPEMAAVGVPRYFHIDRIQFDGREDRASEASLKVLMGVYSDSACTQLKKYIQQDFVSSSAIAEKEKLVASWTASRSKFTAERALNTTTVERKVELDGQIAQLTTQIDAVSAELEDLQPLSLVVSKPAVKTVVKEITEAVLTDAVDSKPGYTNIVVDALMDRFDGAFSSLVEAIAKV